MDDIIDSLTPRLKAVMILWNEGNTSYEVSKALGLSRNSVVSAVSTLVGKGLCKRRKSEVSPLKGKRKGLTYATPPKEPRKIQKAKVSLKKITALEKPAPKVVVDLFASVIDEGYKGPKTIDKLSMFDCRWMIDDDHYCAKKSKDANRPWCPDHFKLVYRKPDKKARAKRTIAISTNLQWGKKEVYWGDDFRSTSPSLLQDKRKVR